MFEYHASGYKKLFYGGLCVVIFEWIMLMLLRTHYFIDLITGLIVAKYLHRFGEYLSFILDVKLLKIPHEKRMSHYYKPCPKCGISKPCASNYVDKTELKNQHILRDIQTGKLVRVETDEKDSNLNNKFVNINLSASNGDTSAITSQDTSKMN